MLDSASYPVLWQIYDATEVRPEWLLPTLQIETGMNPTLPNAQGYPYYGINQVSGTWLAQHGITPSDYLTWPASRQLSTVVLPYLAGQIQAFGPLHSGTRVYQANFLPATLATAKTLSSSVVCRPAAGCPPPGTKTADPYCANRSLDADHSGCITVGDLAHLVGNAAQASNVKTALAATYQLRPWEQQTDPALGLDFGPNPNALTPPTSTGVRLVEVVVLASAVAGLVATWPRVKAALAG